MVAVTLVSLGLMVEKPKLGGARVRGGGVTMCVLYLRGNEKSGGIFCEDCNILN